tara:strand:+ start:52 stop:1044 length:993 start_codon:yes stop_codon:yes gene_type:complete
MEKVDSFKKIITDNDSFIITTHRGPDGDAMGSSMAMYNLLVDLKKNVSVVIPNSFPNFLSWLPNVENVINHEENSTYISKLINKVDVIIMLDFNDLSRIENLESYVSNSKAKKILIDHHQDPDLSICDLSFCDTNYSSTCELLYMILNQAKFNLTKNIADCLYTGILTDTGSFKFSCTTENTHISVGDLISKGVDATEINNLIYNNYSYDRMKLLGHCLTNKLKIYNNNSAIISLSDDELKRFNFKKGDTEGIINYALSIKEVIFAVFIVEKDSIVKLSFRSLGNINVQNISKRYFGGGGHFNAAGAKSDLSLNETIKKVENIIIKNEFS